MSAAFYTALQATAAKLIAAKGQLVTVSTSDSSSYDQSTLVNTEATPTTVFSGAAATLDFKSTEVDGDRIKRGDVKVLLPVASPTMAEIKVGYTISIGGVVHRITYAIPIKPGGIVVLWILGARSGG